jgi:uncharacterized protein with HEPN domain
MRDGGTPVLMDYLEHMVEAVERIQRYLSDVDREAFLGNEEKQDAVIRNFEIIGEAAANVARQYPEFVAQYPEFRWQEAYGMRNVLTHGYFKVEPEVVWKTAQADLPKLKATVKSLLSRLAQESEDDS